MVRHGRDRLSEWVEIDETFIGGLEKRLYASGVRVSELHSPGATGSRTEIAARSLPSGREA